MTFIYMSLTFWLFDIYRHISKITDFLTFIKIKMITHRFNSFALFNQSITRSNFCLHSKFLTQIIYMSVKWLFWIIYVRYYNKDVSKTFFKNNICQWTWIKWLFKSQKGDFYRIYMSKRIWIMKLSHDFLKIIKVKKVTFIEGKSQIKVMIYVNDICQWYMSCRPCQWYK